MRDEELIKAASEGRLRRSGNKTMTWFTIDGKHSMDLDRIERLIGYGKLEERLGDPVIHVAAQN